MREGVMRAGVMAFVGGRSAIDSEQMQSGTKPAPSSERWNPQQFAREQIRGLVRQLFHTTQAKPLRQVVFSAVDPQTNTVEICRSVGEALALDTTMDVAVAGAGAEGAKAGELLVGSAKMRSPLREAGTQVRWNLWHLSLEMGKTGEDAAPLHRYISAVRREFEYSIVAAPAAAISSETMALAQSADGIVLILSAQHTRREQARKIKTMLEVAQARLLGMVLSDREFPIPEKIYRRL